MRQSGDMHWTRRCPERVRRGTAGNSAKLSDADVAELRRLAREFGSSRAWLASYFGVSRVTIWRYLRAS
jgi:hypothetical protein